MKTDDGGSGQVPHYRNGMEAPERFSAGEGDVRCDKVWGPDVGCRCSCREQDVNYGSSVRRVGQLFE